MAISITFTMASGSVLLSLSLTLPLLVMMELMHSSTRRYFGVVLPLLCSAISIPLF